MMPNIPIDFSQRQENPAPARLLLLLAAFFLLTLGGDALWHADQDLDLAKAAFAPTQHQLPIKKHPVKVQPAPVLKLAGKQNQAVLRELTVPWQDLLGILEDYPGQDVALIGIDRTPSQDQIHITAEAKNFEAMIAYLKYL